MIAHPVQSVATLDTDILKVLCNDFLRLETFSCNCTQLVNELLTALEPASLLRCPPFSAPFDDQFLHRRLLMYRIRRVIDLTGCVGLIDICSLSSVIGMPSCSPGSFPGRRHRSSRENSFATSRSPAPYATGLWQTSTVATIGQNSNPRFAALASL
jgi:hypothetical protein